MRMSNSATCPHCGASIAAKIEALRAACAHRTGAYADAYRLGLFVAAGAPAPQKTAGPGYKHGLTLKPYYIKRQGQGCRDRNAAKCAARRKNKSKIVEIVVD